MYLNADRQAQFSCASGLYKSVLPFLNLDFQNSSAFIPVGSWCSKMFAALYHFFTVHSRVAERCWKPEFADSR